MKKLLIAGFIGSVSFVISARESYGDFQRPHTKIPLPKQFNYQEELAKYQESLPTGNWDVIATGVVDGVGNALLDYFVCKKIGLLPAVVACSTKALSSHILRDPLVNKITPQAPFALKDDREKILQKRSNLVFYTRWAMYIAAGALCVWVDPFN